MINTINSNSPYLYVGGGNPSPTYFNHSAPSAGMMRYFNNNIEVYDGVAWTSVSNSYATVGLTPDAVKILNWGRNKMAEEKHLKELADQHPGIKDLQEKLEIMIALVNQDRTPVA